MSTRNKHNRIVFVSGSWQVDNTPKILISQTSPDTFSPYVPFKIAIPGTSQNNQGVHEKTSDKDDNESVNSSSSMSKHRVTPVLCQNCGVQSRTLDRCSSCKKEIRRNNITESKAIIDKINETHDEVKSLHKGVPARSFYARQQKNNDFSRYIQAIDAQPERRPRSRVLLKRSATIANKTAATNECITISSDSEDDTDSSNRHGVSYSSRQGQKSSTRSSHSDTEAVTPPKKLKLDITKDGTSGKNYSRSAESVLNLIVKSLRLGQMKLTTGEVFRVTIDHLVGFVECPDLSIHRVLKIPWSSVTKCEICLEPSEPCMFISLSSGALPALRGQFEMVKGKWPYYDPQGGDDERHFIIYMDGKSLSTSSQCSTADLTHKITAARKKHKKPSEFLQVIDYEESERRQNLSAACQEQRESEQEEMDVLTHDQAASTSDDKPSSPISPTLDVAVSPSSTDVLSLFTGTREKLFVYPPPPMKGGISVTNEDEFCLNPGEFLNDVIIEFYLKYLYNEILSDKDRARSHIFSCFFYERLMQKGKRNIDENPAERRHSQVKKWTRNVDIFTKDFIFVPINEAAHWYLAVICFPGLKGEELMVLDRTQSTTVVKEKKESSKKTKGMISISLPNFKIKRKPLSKDTEQGKLSKSTDSFPNQANTSSSITAAKPHDNKRDRKLVNSELVTNITVKEKTDDIHSNLKKATDYDVTMDDPIRSASLADEKDDLPKKKLFHSMEHALQGSNSSASFTVESNKKKSTISATSEIKPSVPQPTIEANEHKVQSSKVENSSPSTASKSEANQKNVPPDQDLPIITTQQGSNLKNNSLSKALQKKNEVQDPPCETNVQGSKSTSHCAYDSLNHNNNDMMELFVMEHSGDFKLSDNLKRNFIMRPAKSLKIELTKLSDLSPVKISQNPFEDDSESHARILITKCSSSATHNVDSPPKTTKISGSQKLRSSPAKNSPLKYHNTSDNKIVESQSPKHYDATKKCSFRTTLHPNVTVRSRTSYDDTTKIFPESLIKKRRDSDLEMETVRDRPKTSFIADVGALNDSSLDGSKLTSPPSPDIFESSQTDNSNSCNSRDHDRHPSTPVTPISENCAKNSRRNSSVEILAVSRDCDVTDSDITEEQFHIKTKVPLDALYAIRDNYSDCDEVQSPVTVVDGVTPGSVKDSSKEKESSASGGEKKSVYKRPCILIFDSLRGTARSKIATNLREYLAMEWRTRKRETEGERSFDKETMKMCNVPVPQQNNFTDCGLFLLHYVENFFSNPIESFYLPIKGLEEWFDPSECSVKRRKIKDIIRVLGEDWVARQTNDVGRHNVQKRS